MEKIVDYLAEEEKKEQTKRDARRRTRFLDTLQRNLADIQPKPVSLDFLAMGD
jgi:hypothetical protein